MGDFAGELPSILLYINNLNINLKLGNLNWTFIFKLLKTVNHLTFLMPFLSASNRITLHQNQFIKMRESL